MSARKFFNSPIVSAIAAARRRRKSNRNLGKPLGVDFPSLVERARLMSAFGTSERAHADLMLNGILNAACEGSPDNPPSEQDINQVLAVVTGIDAKDEIEGMLATQMVATHVAAIRALRHLKGSKTIPQYNCNGNLAVKLLRTYTMQVEALQRYRGKGQQKVTVEHVHVHAGGQAIVGAIAPGGGGKEQSDEQADRTASPSCCSMASRVST
jgi:hypothetical protein